MTAVTARIVPAPQGSAEWHAHRAVSLNASDLAAVMGLSPYKTRDELLRERATGIVPEVDAYKQRLFDDGHRIEIIARAWAENLLGQDLYAVVLAAEIDGLPLSASLDGQTMLGDINLEAKRLNARLREALSAGLIPEEYLPQMEQGLMLSGAKRCLFVAGDDDTMLYAWYESLPGLRAKIIPAWRQFVADVAAYQHKPADAAAVAAPVEALPAVSVRVDGALVVQSNLPAFGAALKAFVAGVPKEPSTDQEFADAEAACKTLKRAEEALDAAEANALASMADVNAMRTLVEDFRAIARSSRLSTEKLVKARKDSIRAEIVAEAQAQLDAHVIGLNARLGSNWVPRVVGPFGEAIKGLKTVASVRSAVGAALANAKIDASALADRLEANRKVLRQDPADWMFLFADFPVVGSKDTEDFAAVAEFRIAAHKRADAERIEREAQRRAAEIAAQAAAAELAQAADRPAGYGMPQQRRAQDQRAQAPVAETAGTALEGAGAPAVGQPAPTIPDDGTRWSLGDIKELLGFGLSGDFIQQTLGIAPIATDKRAMLFSRAQYSEICFRLAKHVIARRSAP